MLHEINFTEKWDMGMWKPVSELEKEMYVSIRNPDEPVSIQESKNRLSYDIINFNV